MVRTFVTVTQAEVVRLPSEANLRYQALVLIKSGTGLRVSAPWKAWRAYHRSWGPSNPARALKIRAQEGERLGAPSNHTAGGLTRLDVILRFIFILTGPEAGA